MANKNVFGEGRPFFWLILTGAEPRKGSATSGGWTMANEGNILVRLGHEEVSAILRGPRS
jgi:hypothetical protein